MSSTKTRWILTFDASCGTCRAVAQVIESERRGKGLELLSLADRDVERWRIQALGTNPPWAPTLLEVGPTGVRGWTGTRMGVRLVGRLGLRGTTRALRALGGMTSVERGAADGSPGVPRKGFLRLAAGALVAGGLVLAGRAPAFADGGAAGEVRSWLKANKGSLPSRYEDVVSYSMPYRKAIFAESAPEVKSALWVAHVERFRASGRDLTEQQVAVLERAVAVMGDVSLFERRIRSGDEADRVVSELKTAAIEAFGRDDAYGLIAQLGPPAKAGETVLADCACATEDDWCGGHCEQCCWSQLNCDCGNGSGCCCRLRESGCGSLWEYICDGVCYG